MTIPFHPILAEDFRRIADSIPSVCNQFANRRVMITGAAGLIGAYLTEFFVWMRQMHGINIKIACLDNWATGRRERIEYLSNAVTIIEHDISKVFGSPAIIKTERWANTKEDWQADYIFNAASIAAPKFYLATPWQTIKVHVEGTQNICDYALVNDARLIHLSSVEVYGEPTITPTPETDTGNVDQLNPRACYSESKRLSETICMMAYRERKANVVIARPFNIYGPRERLDSGRVIPNIISAALDGHDFLIYGSGEHTRSYCYLSDAIIQLLSIAISSSAGEVFNMGDGNSEVSLLDLAHLGKRLFNIQYHQVANAGGGEPTKRKPDTEKILKIAPASSISIEAGLIRTYESYRT